MSQKKGRRSYTPEQKAEILRRHLVDKHPVSDLCDEYKLQPSLVYTWLRQLLENAPLALQGPNRRGRAPSLQSQLEEKIGKLEAKLAKKDEVIAEISEEFVSLKKKRTWGALSGAPPLPTRTRARARARLPSPGGGEPHHPPTTTVFSGQPVVRVGPATRQGLYAPTSRS